MGNKKYLDWNVAPDGFGLLSYPCSIEIGHFLWNTELIINKFEEVGVKIDSNSQLGSTINKNYSHISLDK